MSEQVETSNQQMIVIGLAVIAVLLVAIVGILVWQQAQAAQIPAPIAATGTSAGDPAAVTPPAGMGGSASGAVTTEFDAKTAIKVPAGMTPEQLVKAYHEAVKAGKYDEAYTMLPLDKQQSYGDSKAYAGQLEAYGITGYELGKPVDNGDTFEMDATQVTPQMPITYTWKFKKVDGQWFVASRNMAGQ